MLAQHNVYAKLFAYSAGFVKYCFPGRFSLRFFTPPFSIVSSAELWDSVSDCFFVAYCCTFCFSDNIDLLTSVLDSSDGVSTTALFIVKVEFRESNV